MVTSRNFLFCRWELTLGLICERKGPESLWQDPGPLRRLACVALAACRSADAPPTSRLPAALSSPCLPAPLGRRRVGLAGSYSLSPRGRSLGPSRCNSPLGRSRLLARGHCLSGIPRCRCSLLASRSRLALGRCGLAT